MILVRMRDNNAAECRRKNTVRNRAFVFLFSDGAHEELSSLQAVETHAFPHHFAEMKKKVGLAPAAIVSARGSDSSVLKSIDANRPVRSNYPLIDAKKFSGEKDEQQQVPQQTHAGNQQSGTQMRQSQPCVYSFPCGICYICLKCYYLFL